MADEAGPPGPGDEALTAFPAHRYDLVVPDGAIAAAVLLHPHPDYGGDRRNVVVDALFRRLPAEGVAVVRFDFTSANLMTGALDAMAAIDLLPALPVTVIGYSFGALVAGEVLDERATSWVLVAPPVGQRTPAVARNRRPKLVLAAEHDQFTSVDDMLAATGTWLSTTVDLIPGTDHFVGGATDRVGDLVVEWILE